jgi:hypothetical protein
MDGACGTSGGFGGGHLMERDHSGDLDLDVSSRWAGMDWTTVPQDRDRWRALVSAVMNLRVP